MFCPVFSMLSGGGGGLHVEFDGITLGNPFGSPFGSPEDSAFEYSDDDDDDDDSECSSDCRASDCRASDCPPLCDMTDDEDCSDLLPRPVCRNLPDFEV
jgi:hypothetical protein